MNASRKGATFGGTGHDSPSEVHGYASLAAADKAGVSAVHFACAGFNEERYIEDVTVSSLVMRAEHYCMSYKGLNLKTCPSAIPASNRDYALSFAQKLSDKVMFLLTVDACGSMPALVFERNQVLARGWNVDDYFIFEHYRYISCYVDEVQASCSRDNLHRPIAE